MQKVVLVGRANVGKSTLFNCFSPKYKAITKDTPGVTRDVKSADVEWYDFKFRIVDTPGYHNDALISAELVRHMDQQIQYEVRDADVVFFVVDGVEGLTPRDRDIALLLRRTGRRIVVIVNKCDRKDASIEPFYELGFDPIIPISSAHKEGFNTIMELFDGLDAHHPCESEDPLCDSKKVEPRFHEDDSMGEPPLESDVALPRLPIITIMGRPNVGKSSLTNTYLGEDRQLVGAMPGLTRDSVNYTAHYKGNDFTLMDTAGLRKKSKMHDALEALSADSTRQALRYTQGVILMMDATELNPYDLDHQDMALLGEIVEEGRCVCIAVNKCDLLLDQNAALEEVQFQIRKKFFDIPVIPISVKTGQNVDVLLKTMLTGIGHFTKRISTAKLNEWIREVVSHHTMPTQGGRALKLKFMTQVSVSPPKFAVFVNRKFQHMHSFERFLMHRLRQEFHYQGIPLRINWRAPVRRYSS